MINPKKNFKATFNIIVGGFLDLQLLQ